MPSKSAADHPISGELANPSQPAIADFPTFRRRAFPLRKVPKRLRKPKASHTDPKQPFEHVEPV
uniref:Uncharacterized protein n=1 Tax=Oryza sativa subsp. japonica TaxID=39947 RepID=Q6Z0E7_ORYSJ|nr:hypothetical protein [Oryza sativa Japonica Group]